MNSLPFFKIISFSAVFVLDAGSWMVDSSLSKNKRDGESEEQKENNIFLVLQMKKEKKRHRNRMKRRTFFSFFFQVETQSSFIGRIQ